MGIVSFSVSCCFICVFRFHSISLFSFNVENISVRLWYLIPIRILIQCNSLGNYLDKIEGPEINLVVLLKYVRISLPVGFNICFISHIKRMPFEICYSFNLKIARSKCYVWVCHYLGVLPSCRACKTVDCEVV